MGEFRLPFNRTVSSFIAEKQYIKKMACSGWSFSSNRLHMIRHEREDWMLHYLPIDLRGKTVLDVGAGEGETAKLFLEAGAAKVICIECDPERKPFLLENARHFPLEVIFRACTTGDFFRQDIDFIKCDIEGYEEMVLPYRLPVPAVFEVHGLQMRDKFKAVGYRMVLPEDGNWWTCYGYWRC